MSAYSEIELTEQEKAVGFAPLLVSLIQKRMTMLAYSALTPGMTEEATNFVRGRNLELLEIMHALQDAGVRMPTSVGQPDVNTEPNGS